MHYILLLFCILSASSSLRRYGSCLLCELFYFGNPRLRTSLRTFSWTMSGCCRCFICELCCELRIWWWAPVNPGFLSYGGEKLPSSPPYFPEYMKQKPLLFVNSLVAGLTLCLGGGSCSQKSSETVNQKINLQQGTPITTIGDEVILRILAAYNNAASFQCDGTLRGKINSGTVSQADEKQTRILFVRPHCLRVEWSNLNPVSPKTNLIIASASGACLYLSPSLKPQKSSSLQAAVDATAGVSSELSSFIPRLLLGDNNSIRFKNNNDFREVEIDGRQHFLLVGINSSERRIELAIDRETYVISEVKETFSVKGSELQKQLGATQIGRNLPDLDIERVVRYTNVKFNEVISPSTFDQVSGK